MRKGIGYLFLIIMIYTSACTKPTEENKETAFKVPQGESPCTLQGSFIDLSDNGLPLTTLTGIEKNAGRYYGDSYKIEANLGSSNIGDFNRVTIHFSHLFNTANLPPDGVYTTGTWDGNFKQFSNRVVDSVFIDLKTNLPDYYFYTSVPKQKMYLKRVNGKIKITICNMIMYATQNYVSQSIPMVLSLIEG